MPKVFNWQLGREMDYPYEGHRPQKQFCMIMDTNKCIACQTCTVTCKSTWTWGKGQEYMLWNNIETKPYGFYPTGWDVNILDGLGEQPWKGGAYEGKTIFEAAPDGTAALAWEPSEEDWNHPNLGEDEPTGDAAVTQHIPDVPHSNMWMYYLQRICNHCTYPACLAACPRQAVFKRDEDGIVLIDQERCRGYQECVAACPYKKSLFNPETHVSEKCIGCYPKIEQDLQTQCTTVCIGKLRLTDFLNPPEKADRRNPADFLVHFKKVALPLYPQLGLEPNVYYIPPVHVPEDYLGQMFGPGVAQAVETYRNAKDDEELLGCLMLFGATERIIHSFDVKDGVARGYDRQGRELVAVPVREPELVREFSYETALPDGTPATGFRHNT
ncbi:MAG: 4Fe-4S dicluster domain-containing protein [Thermoleophilia bacterium]